MLGYVLALTMRAISRANAGSPIWGAPVTTAFDASTFDYPTVTTNGGFKNGVTRIGPLIV